MPLTVSALNIYPVKSLAGCSLPGSPLLKTGLAYDRQWMVVDKRGQFLTQRSHPQMALIQTAIDQDNLVLSSFAMEDHVVPQPNQDASRIPTSVWGDDIDAVTLDSDTDEWISQAIGDECRLVTFPRQEKRHCNPERSLPQDHTYFADGFPLLIVCQESLDLLNEKLEKPVGMDRFRPNLVIKGATPHAEDDWHRIQVGSLNMRIVDACARCSVPTVDPSSGVLAGPEPIHTLSSYRQRDGEVFFGMNATPDDEGVIEAGDEVIVLD